MSLTCLSGIDAKHHTKAIKRLLYELFRFWDQELRKNELSASLRVIFIIVKFVPRGNDLISSRPAVKKLVPSRGTRITATLIIK